MEAHKCDRCGKYVDGNIMPEIRGWGSERAKVVGTPRISMELCPECFDALKKFLLLEDGDMEGCYSCKYGENFDTEKEPCKYCYGLSMYTKKEAGDDNAT